MSSSQGGVNSCMLYLDFFSLATQVNLEINLLLSWDVVLTNASGHCVKGGKVQLRTPSSRGKKGAVYIDSFANRIYGRVAKHAYVNREKFKLLR